MFKLNRDKKIQVNLTKSEALVLFDLLSRIQDHKDNPTITLDAAERTAFSGVLGDLEKVLTEPLKENYKELLAKAKKEVQWPGDMPAGDIQLK